MDIIQPSISSKTWMIFFNIFIVRGNRRKPRPISNNNNIVRGNRRKPRKYHTQYQSSSIINEVCFVEYSGLHWLLNQCKCSSNTCNVGVKYGWANPVLS